MVLRSFFGGTLDGQIQEGAYASKTFVHFPPNAKKELYKVAWVVQLDSVTILGYHPFNPYTFSSNP